MTLGKVSPSISPYLFYEDVASGFQFLLDVFGLEKRSVHEKDGEIVNAQAGIGDYLVVIGQARGDRLVSARKLGGVSPSAIMLIVDDVDAHFTRAKDGGAEIWYEPTDMPYGLREYGAFDLEGNPWFFATAL
ncbi:VOC family protein [Nocardia sp. NPDC051321]|uniref:VOC family protein n=1 Tax=Nocardia sp. NPDC051321 TaxID=3364323 RepID=UPI00378FE81D